MPDGHEGFGEEPIRLTVLNHIGPKTDSLAKPAICMTTSSALGVMAFPGSRVPLGS